MNANKPSDYVDIELTIEEGSTVEEESIDETVIMIVAILSGVLALTLAIILCICWRKKLR